MSSVTPQQNIYFSMETTALPLLCPAPIFNHMQKSIIHGAGERYSFPLYSSNNITGCILIFEYLYFLLQSNNLNQRHTLELAIDTYQKSGTQATVSNSLQDAIHQHENNHDTLSKVIIDIIVDNQMCKSSPP